MQQFNNTKYTTKLKTIPMEILKGVDAFKAQTTRFLTQCLRLFFK